MAEIEPVGAGTFMPWPPDAECDSVRGHVALGLAPHGLLADADGSKRFRVEPLAFLFNISAHADGERRGRCVDLKVSTGAFH